MNLRGFLMRQPRPVAIRVLTVEGDEKLLQVDPRIPWSQIASYVEGLDPETVECLDSESRILRGTNVGELDDTETEDGGIERSAAAAITARVKAPTDPQSAQLVLFAQLLADAYRHTTDVAFDKMISLFEQVNKRYELTEKALDRLHKTVERLTEQRIERAASEQDELTLSDLANAWQGGAQQAEQRPQQPAQPAPRREPPPPGHYPSNGRAPHA